MFSEIVYVKETFSARFQGWSYYSFCPPAGLCATSPISLIHLPCSFTPTNAHTLTRSHAHTFSHVLRLHLLQPASLSPTPCPSLKRMDCSPSPFNGAVYLHVHFPLGLHVNYRVFAQFMIHTHSLSLSILQSTSSASQDVW